MKHLYIALLLLSPIVAWGQERKKASEGFSSRGLEMLQNSLGGEKKAGSSTGPTIISKVGDNMGNDSVTRRMAARQMPDISRYDYALYQNIIKQYGYWKGIGKPLTKDEASHLSLYFKLSRPTKSGPYTYVQTLNSYGRLRTENYMGTYLGNPYDDNDEGMDRDWRSLLQNVCQWETVAGASGVVEENAYDSNGNLIYQYFPTPLSKTHIVGHFADAYGRPALIRKDKSVEAISILLDENGYEEQFSFTDKDGYLKRNQDSVFISIRKHDKEGRTIRILSCDANGQPVLDRWGNCGWDYTYDDRGNELTGQCLNQHLQPMRMPLKIATTDIIFREQKFDIYGRIIKAAYYDEHHQPDTLKGGAHHYEYTWDEHGNRTSCTCFDLNGHWLNMDSGLARWEQYFDENSNNLGYINYTQDTLLANDNNGYCIRRYQYDKEGNQMLRLDYKTTNGRDSVLTHKEVSHNGCDTTWYYGMKEMDVTLHDSRGLTTEFAQYDLEGKPIMWGGYHKYTYSYIDTPHHYLRTETYTDTIGRLCDVNTPKYSRNYNVQINEVDSLTHTKTFTKLVDGHVRDKWANTWDENFNNSTCLMYYDSIGSGWGRSHMADALYYKAIPVRNEKGTAIAWRGLNEFDEPSYILNGDWDGASIYCTNVVGDKYYYNENGDSIPSSQRREHKDSLSKVFCIELTDSNAYRLGLRTGDLIVRYGDFQRPVADKWGRYYESILNYESVLKARTEKKMVVMRHHPETKTSELIQLNMPAGTPAEIGFIFHMLYLTEKEKTRYNRVTAEHGDEIELDSENCNPQARASVHFVTPDKVGSKSNTKAFQAGLRENCIVIGWENFHDGTSHFVPINDEWIQPVQMLYHAYDSVALYYTVDGERVKRFICTKSMMNDIRRSNTNLPSADFVYRLADSLQVAYQRKHGEETDLPQLTPQEAAQRLAQYSASTIDQADKETSEKELKRLIYLNDYEDLGDIVSIKRINFDPDSATLDEIFQVKNLLINIDFTGYERVRNSQHGVMWAKTKGNDITQIIVRSRNRLTFIEGKLCPEKRYLFAAEVTANGSMRENGMEGNYIFLQYNNWRFGQSRSVLEEELAKGRNSEKNVAVMRIEEIGGEIVTGDVYQMTLPAGMLGITWGEREHTNAVYQQACAAMKKVKKYKKK